VNVKSVTDRKIWLAPLAGYTDNAFRRICKECGVDVLVSEMVSADGLMYERSHTLEYARFTQEQRPFFIQIFGNDPLIMAKGAEILTQFKPEGIDINMGCPVKKVVKRGAGSALMQTPELAENIVKEVRSALDGTGIMLSTKFRSGWDNNSINYLDFGKRMENAGVDFLCLHPRTRSQMFAGTANREQIKILKQSVSVPVIGNGDIDSIFTGLEMFEMTGCDSIMIGRGSLGKPWIFKEIRSALDGTYTIPLDYYWKYRVIERHLQYVLEDNDQNQEQAIKEFRTHVSTYTKGIPGGSKIRNIINRTTDPNVIMFEMKRLFRI
jgi:tRNA-dihydrouridine synthase B